MQLFNKKTEEEKEQIKKQAAIDAKRKEDEKREIKFLASPQGRAKTMFNSGAKLFQIELPISQTTARVAAMIGAFTDKSNFDNTSTLEAIESEGWKLEQAGYVYRVLGSVSRDKFLSSGQQEAVSGEIIGIYIFRRIDK